MGEVFLAEDTRLHRRVALKVLPSAVASDPEHLIVIDVVVRTRGSATRMVAVRTRDIP